MNRYVIIATRHTEEECNNPSTDVGKLKHYLEDAGWSVKFMRDCKSIFQAYSQGVEELDVQDEDKVILCHDDIEVLFNKETFNTVIDSWLSLEKCGFVGVAGSAGLAEEGNWVVSSHKTKREQGGFIWHGPSMPEARFDYFGRESQAIQVDGVFMVTTGKVLKDIELRKPKIFEGGWHWYDAYYCLQAHLKGYNNFIMRLALRHSSGGNYDHLFYADMQNFSKLFRKYLPVVVRQLQK